MIHKGFLAAFQVSMLFVRPLVSHVVFFLFLVFSKRMASVRWKQMHNTNVSFHKETLCWEKSAWGVLGSFQVSMLFMKFCIDGMPQGFSQPTEDDNMPC